jgi:hypothetical protein
MTMEQLREKADKLKTLRYDCHIFIPKKIVPMIAKDVPAGQRYSTAVAEVIEDEIMSVNKDGNFNPNEPVTRAMFAQVIKNLKDKGFIVKQP